MHKQAALVTNDRLLIETCLQLSPLTPACVISYMDVLLKVQVIVTTSGSGLGRLDLGLMRFVSHRTLCLVLLTRRLKIIRLVSGCDN